MEPAAHLDLLAVEVAAYSAALRGGSLEAPVDACPGWTLRDLTLHLGTVHRWGADSVGADGPPAQRDAVVDDLDLADWFDEGAAELQALLAADPHAPAWTFLPPRTAASWARRQAFETLVHRIDAQRAVGAVQRPVDPAAAADGVEEVVTGFLPRQLRLGRSTLPAAAVRLVGADSGRAWLLGDGDPAATLTAPDVDLLLLLWRRLDRTGATFRTDGEIGALDAMLASDLTP